MNESYCSVEELQKRTVTIVKTFQVYLNPREMTHSIFNTSPDKNIWIDDIEASKISKIPKKSLYRRIRLYAMDIFQYENRFWYRKEDIDRVILLKKPKGMKQIGLGILHVATLERLRKANIPFETEKRFKDLKLPFDVYLPEQNIAVEIQGPQHFFTATNWNDRNAKKAHTGLCKQIERDNQKIEYCKSKNIDLVWITVDSDIDDFFTYLKDRKTQSKWFHRGHLDIETWLNDFEHWMLFAYWKDAF